ncbi:ROK family transcriptional regulator [Gryllotalpicola ginsengisoli]|uniref:ROK family transcriptional regulator n=1 Tax=Gryllotalpicola ginsengisoli TaxID=444608 RepID=UPI000428D13E|nr:ROK family transcriptional regulator [Gryllotalpicola ginsengisoli]
MKRYGGLSQIELAGATGLSPATVSNIVKELTQSGVLHTSPSTRSGRRSQHVTLARKLGLVAGVHVAPRHLRVAVSDVAGTVVAEHHMPLAKDHRADAELDRVALMLADMVDSVEATPPELLAVGLALPAPYDRRSGLIARPGIMRGWDGVAVAEVLERRVGCPVVVDNASNLAALAEQRSGAARGRQHAIVLDIGDGIGVGLIVHGVVLRGHSGVAGEFGHTVVQQDGPPCRCGKRGCLEAVAGGPALLDALAGTYRGLKLGDVVLRAMAGDAACMRVLADAGRTIGAATANLCNILDPERVVVDGELARAGELLLGPLRHAVEASVIVGHDQVPDIVQGQLGVRAPTLGAAALAIDSLTLESHRRQPAN